MKENKFKFRDTEIVASLKNGFSQVARSTVQVNAIEISSFDFSQVLGDP